MSEKSYVTVEYKACLVCGQSYSTNVALLDRRLRKRFEPKTVTGWGLCDADQAKFEQGYLALVEVDPAKSKLNTNGAINLESAYRTGDVVHIKRHVARQIFNVAIPDDLPMGFCEPEVVERLRAMSDAQD